ncbi:MAG TPA: S1C family serine protease, partial [Phycisphaerae bacterium]|nr:S1C family serine protease [Phycisphaerae bacterium]
MNRARRGLVIAGCAAALLASAVRGDETNRQVLAEGRDALFAEVVARAQAFTVQIETVGGAQPLGALPTLRTQHEDEGTQPTPDPNRFRDDPGSGFLIADGPTTGIVYDADGHILTSSFNFVREPSIITVRLPDGRQTPATIVARDRVRKLTMLKVDASGLTPPEWAPRDQIRPGQWAIAVGKGLGGEGAVSVGIVSATGRMLGNAIQTDAKLSP